MRIAVLTNAYPPPMNGGVARIASMQVQMLEAAGEDVRVWHPEVPWFAASPFKRLRCHLADLFARNDLAQEILAWKPDVLIKHNLTGCGFGTPHAIQRHGVRWIHLLHDVQLFEPSGQVRDARAITPWQQAWALLRSIAFGKPDLLISPTLWLYQQHRRRGFFWRTPHVIMPNPGPAPKRIDRKPHQPLRLLYVGRIAKDKGSDILYYLAMQTTSLFDLEIIGDGPDLPLFEKLSHKIRLSGQRTSEEVMEAMESADVLLVPSHLAENQPTVILEAASRGLPVIATEKAGIKETLNTPHQYGTDRRSDVWLMLIRDLTHPEAYAKASEHMRQIAERHDPEAYAHQFLSLLKSNL
jgi:glycosyltransferase involved in cell wall biosynthesis